VPSTTWPDFEIELFLFSVLVRNLLGPALAFPSKTKQLNRTLPYPRDVEVSGWWPRPCRECQPGVAFQMASQSPDQPARRHPKTEIGPRPIHSASSTLEPGGPLEKAFGRSTSRQDRAALGLFRLLLAHRPTLTMLCSQAKLDQ
jgi:hypothetical protein